MNNDTEAQVEFVKEVKTKNGRFSPAIHHERFVDGILTGFLLVIFWMVVKLIIDPKPEWIEVIILCFLTLIGAHIFRVVGRVFYKDLEDL